MLFPVSNWRHSAVCVRCVFTEGMVTGCYRDGSGSRPDGTSEPVGCMVVAVRRLRQLTRRVDSPYLRRVRPYVLGIPDFFGIWAYLHIHNKIPRVWDPILNMKLVCLNTYDANFIFVAFRLRPVMCSQAWNFPVRVCVRAQKVSGFGTF